MRLKSLSLFIFVLAIGLAGCSPKTTETVARNEAPPSEPASAESASPSEEESTPTEETGEAAPKPVKTAPLSEVPANLKNDAYSYYGLGNLKTVNLEMTANTLPSAVKGAKTIRFLGVKDGKPKFQVEHSGELMALGTSEMTLGTDGLKLTNTTVGKLDQPAMELPASLKPGTTWKGASMIENTSQGTVKETTTYKVIGEKPVTTKAGSYTALLIEAKSDATMEGKKVKVTSQAWYVKDRGLVKTIMKMVPDDPAKAQTVTIQEIK